MSRRMESEGKFIVFDGAGAPIRKLSKELAWFDVAAAHFRHIPDDIGLQALDYSSTDGIAGLLLARSHPHLQASIYSARGTSGSADRTERVMKIMDANSVGNAQIVNSEDLEKLPDGGVYDCIILEQRWGETKATMFNTLVRLSSALKPGGSFLCISHKTQGAERLQEYLDAAGLRTEVVQRGRGGVRLLEVTVPEGTSLCEVDTAEPVTFAFGDEQFEAVTDEQVFSRENLDTGTRLLLDTVLARNVDLTGKRIGDLGCGWGAISLVLARQYPTATIAAIEKSPRAVELARRNLAHALNVTVFESDLAGDLPPTLKPGSIDTIISNPPFHVSEQERVAIFQRMKRLLTSGGEMYFVVERSFLSKFEETASRFFNATVVEDDGHYAIVHCVK